MITPDGYIIDFNLKGRARVDMGRSPGNTLTEDINQAYVYPSVLDAANRVVTLLEKAPVDGLYDDFKIRPVTKGNLLITDELRGFAVSFKDGWYLKEDPDISGGKCFAFGKQKAQLFGTRRAALRAYGRLLTEASGPETYANATVKHIAFTKESTSSFITIIK